MAGLRDKTFAKNEVTSWSLPNYWDFIALFLVLGVIALLGWGASQMAVSFEIGDVIPISLDPRNLPYYALRTVLRMLIAMVCSLLFTVIFGTLAAKNKQAERIIIPMIDILQSIPVLGFMTISITPFMYLFPGSLLGPECAAIFAIFTSQVWNMTLSFYQSVRAVPHELKEASAMFHLSPWKSFWRLDVPFAMPGLIWNAMMSMSASWFFVVAAEAITAFNPNITLPGIGSYIDAALRQENHQAIGYAIIAMFIVILCYDQLIFRPLNQWIDRFKFEEEDEAQLSESWMAMVFGRTRLMRIVGQGLDRLWDGFVSLPIYNKQHDLEIVTGTSQKARIAHHIVTALVVLVSLGAAFMLTQFVLQKLSWHEVVHVFYLGGATGLRVMILIILSSIIWVPVGVWIGLRPNWTRRTQPIIQFLAAFPANLLYPVMIWLIVTYHLNVEIWTSPLIILGTQWYILFNVIVGTIALPKSYIYVADNFHLSGWLWWKRLILPGIFPYFVTGAITAAGGAWNASIVAEYLRSGDTIIMATGIGAYIAKASAHLDYPRLTLSIAIMCLFVVTINRLIWQPLYRLAERRYIIE